MEANHSEFWDVAYRDNAPALLGVLRRYVKDVSIAHDLLHEVFVAAIDKYEGYSGKGSFEGWLYRIAVNTALMYLRNERNSPVQTEHAASLLSVMDDDDSDDEKVDNARATIEAAGFTSEELLSAIDRLPEHHKLVFNMYVMDDFSHKQIGAELNISPGTSKSHLARARKKIQQFLYDDALNKKKKKDKRWASAFLLLFPAKKHYIDRLFRDGLSDYQIPPTGDLKIQGFKDSKIQGFQNLKMESLNVEALKGVNHGILESLNHGIFSYMAACCGTAAVTGSICWLSMSDNSPLNRDNDRMEKQVIVNDTLMFTPNQTVEDAIVFEAGIQDGRNAARNVSTDNGADNDGKDAARHVFTDNGADNDATDAARHVSTDNGADNDGIDAARHVSTDSVLPAPVVVKKQIIQHQTVVVRDTIFIIE